MFLEDQFLPNGDVFSDTDTDSLTLSGESSLSGEVISISSSSSSFFGCCENCPCRNVQEYLNDIIFGFDASEQQQPFEKEDIFNEKIDAIVESKMKTPKCLKCKKKGRTCGKWKVKEQENCECNRISFHKRKLQKNKSRTKRERNQSRDEKYKK